jgi:hypothetical protein
MVRDIACRVALCLLLVVLACCIGEPRPPTKDVYASVMSKRARAETLLNEGKYEEARYVRRRAGCWEAGLGWS